jgi:hypothetical protein
MRDNSHPRLTIGRRIGNPESEQVQPSLARRIGEGREDTRGVQTAQVCAVSKDHFTQNLRGPLRRLASLFVHELPIFTDTPAAMTLDSDDEVRLLPRTKCLQAAHGGSAPLKWNLRRTGGLK